MAGCTASFRVKLQQPLVGAKAMPRWILQLGRGFRETSAFILIKKKGDDCCLTSPHMSLHGSMRLGDVERVLESTVPPLMCPTVLAISIPQRTSSNWKAKGRSRVGAQNTCPN